MFIFWRKLKWKSFLESRSSLSFSKCTKMRFCSVPLWKVLCNVTSTFSVTLHVAQTWIYIENKMPHSSKTFDWFLCCLRYLLGISVTYNIYILFWPTCIVARMAVVNNCTLSPRPPAITHQTWPEYSLRIKVNKKNKTSPENSLRRKMEWKVLTSAQTGICFTFFSFFRSSSMKM